MGDDVGGGDSVGDKVSEGDADALGVMEIEMLGEGVGKLGEADGDKEEVTVSLGDAEGEIEVVAEGEGVLEVVLLGEDEGEKVGDSVGLALGEGSSGAGAYPMYPICPDGVSVKYVPTPI